MKIIQGASPYTVTWPSTVLWAAGTVPTISTGSGAKDVMSFWYDGTNYFGVASQNFS